MSDIGYLKTFGRRQTAEDRKRNLFFCFLFSVFCFLFSVLSPLFSSVCFAETTKYIRVAIIQDAGSLDFSVKGFYKIIDSKTKKILLQGKYLNTSVSLNKSGILAAGKNYKTGKLLVKAEDPEAIIINGRKFRGNIEFIKKGSSHLSAVNHIEIEDYIKGILYHETSHYWPQEALKAQAVVCRTYALYQSRQNRLKDYDVTSDIYSQVYGGKTSERYRTNLAVNRTKGEIITYANGIVPAYFHAACGGHTEAASILWNTDNPALKGVNCNFCKDSPHFNWQRVLSLKEIKEALSKSGSKGVSDIKTITILGRDLSGRITDLEIESDNAGIKISAKDFRGRLGPNIIRSANFKVDVAGSEAVFTGLGWGHGVGMCQWGAYFMAKQGYGYRQILEYYYPGIEISKISS